MSTFVSAAVASIKRQVSTTQTLHVVFDRYCETSIKGKKVIGAGPDANPVDIGIGAQGTTVTHEEAS